MNLFESIDCTRCQEARWPGEEARAVTPFVCQRCRQVLAGGQAVVDPKPSEARQEQARRRNASGSLVPFRSRNS